MKPTKASFHPPAKVTKARFFSQQIDLAMALAAREPWVVLDEGVPLAFAPKGRGLLRLKGGERVKRWKELERVLLWLAESGAERGQPLLVIGGGATLDLGAFAASLYRRGMPLLLVPTTLLGMVDATLGGKTAVDFEHGGHRWKNFAGTFYPAEEIWVHGSFLNSLPKEERRSGAGEVFKTMWIRGGAWNPRSLLEFVEGAEARRALLALVRECLAVKAKVVALDPLDERRVREVLNFGHTAGHAIELATGVSHGEAVLWGMAVESWLAGSKAMQRLTLEALRSLFLEIPGRWRKQEGWEAYLRGDKKLKRGKIDISVLSAPGLVKKKRVASSEVAAALRAFPEFYRRAGSNPRA